PQQHSNSRTAIRQAYLTNSSSMLDYEVDGREERRTTMLQRIAEDIWSQETNLRLAAGVRMPCRATIMRLSDGGLVVYSPLAIDDATAKELDAIGDVRFLVAPN